MAHVAHNRQHEGLNAGDSQVIPTRMFAFVLQDVLHDEDDVFNELGVAIDHNNLRKESISHSFQWINKPSYLARGIEKFIHKHLDLIKEDGIDVWVELMPNQLLHMFLYLRSKLLIVADQQLQKLPNEPEVNAFMLCSSRSLTNILSNRAVLHVPTTRQNAALPAVNTRVSCHG